MNILGEAMIQSVPQGMVGNELGTTRESREKRGVVSHMRSLTIIVVGEVISRIGHDTV